MIKLEDGRWCYSPAMPKAYEKAYVAQDDPDLARWNMVYLTFCGELEDIRSGSISPAEFRGKVLPAEAGRVEATASAELAYSGLDGNLRNLATKPLPLFIHQFPNIDFSNDRAAKLFNGTWADRVLANAKKIFEAHCEAADAVSVIDPALTNVLMFAKQKSAQRRS
jgi:hypothetical protein